VKTARIRSLSPWPPYSCGQGSRGRPEQVDADQHRQALAGGQQRARRDQAVEARSAVEGDVVADRDVVQARRRDPVADDTATARREAAVRDAFRAGDHRAMIETFAR
jgi:hypothetical protein